MTVRDWIESRRPAPPPEMALRIIQSLGDRARMDARDVAAACLDAAVDQLQSLLATDSVKRESAIELLAVDALATYAFEAAADTIDRLDDDATEAMVRLAVLADDGEQPAAES